jgi:GH18 family chitinase
MNKLILLLSFSSSLTAFCQYSFPGCYSTYESGLVYTQGQHVSFQNRNYEAKYWTNTAPPGADWTNLGGCGSADVVVGPAYPNTKRVIGYMPSWNTTYNFNDYDPSKLTNVIVSFLEFKMNNTNFNSVDFASIQFTTESVEAVSNVLITKELLSKSHAVQTKVSVAIGGAEDYGFLWLMNTYFNNDAKLNEIAQLIVNYADQKGIDGVDLDMECWWSDPAISGTTDLGGRIRGSKWNDPDEGPHQAAVGLKKLAQKIKSLRPSLLTSAAVFGTSWYGNNYDDGIAQHLDWIGLMTYDFTGSWSTSPHGPHTALRKTPLNTYVNQSLDNPIYSAQDALEYWQGISTSTWNHDGGFSVPRSKLCIGSAFYGYDFSTPKPAGNGYSTLSYKDIVQQFPTAPTSYDLLDPINKSGFIGLNGKSIFYETPLSIKNKFNYVDSYGHQGIIIWELTNDLHPNNPNSLLSALSSQTGLGIEDRQNNIFQLYSSGNKIYFSNNEKGLVHNKFIEVYSLMGQQLERHMLLEAKGFVTSKLPAGLYIVKVNSTVKKLYLE